MFIQIGMQQNRDFRISAGTQEKTALLQYNSKWCLPIKATPTTHIFKLPLGMNNNKFDITTSVENEWFCGENIKCFGIDVANMQILNFDEQKVLVVEGFDRKLSDGREWIMRLSQEDMCQAMGIVNLLSIQQVDIS